MKFRPLYPCRNLNDVELMPSIPMPQDILTCKRRPFNREYQHSMHIQSLKGYAAESEILSACDKRECAGKVPMISAEGFLPVSWQKIPKDSGKPRITYEPHLAMREGERRAQDEKFFAYNAIEQGQYFYGEISSQDPELLDSILSVCEEKVSGENEGCWETDILVGKGITRGYGKLNIFIKPIQESKINPLPLKDRISEQEAISMLFLADTILLDSWGRTLSAFTSKNLSEVLGLSVEVIHTFISLKDVEGFAAVTGLPKFRDLAIKAGSVIGFKCLGGDSREEIYRRLEEIEIRGLGLRCHEGFGMISFNHVVYDMEAWRKRLKPINNPFQHDRKPQTKWQSLEQYLKSELKAGIKIGNKSVCDRDFARWIYANRFKKSDELISLVKKYGELNMLKEYYIEQREKDISKKLVELRKQAQDLLTKISSILESISKKYTETEKITIREQLWPFCMEWLANQIIVNEER